MSILYLHFEDQERQARVNKLASSGARVLVTEPRWPAFFELAKREKPHAIAIDFSRAPSHALETADYLAKARESREAKIYLLRVPEDRLDLVKRRLPQAELITEEELSERLAQEESEAQALAEEKKKSAAEAKEARRAAKAREKTQAPVTAKRAQSTKRPVRAKKPKASKSGATGKKKAPAKRPSRRPKKK